mgnify:FL=1
MENAKWTRPRTSRIYLHPPLAERLVVLYPDFKVTDSSLLDNGTHLSQPGIGFTLLHGEEMEAFDYEDTFFSPVSDGLPIYTLHNKVEKNSNCCSVMLEAFDTFDRKPATCFKVTVKNESSVPFSDCLGLLCRSGQSDAYMTQLHMEGYAPYVPNLKNWYMLKRTWEQTGETSAAAEDGSVFLQFPKEASFRWLKDGPKGHLFEAADYFRMDYTLQPGESLSFVGMFRHGETEAFDYEALKEETIRNWKKIQANIEVFPDTDNPFYRNMYLQLLTQCCQMLAHYEGSDLVATRQGDLGRFIWPYESAVVLTALDQVGLRAHTGDGYRYFCERWLVTEGEDKGRIQSGCGAWENFTGSVLWGASEHLKYSKDPEELSYFLPKLKMMLDWIQRRRTTPSTGYPGIFPSGKGSDWPDVAQFWTFTDSYNVKAVKSMAEMLDQYGREEAKEAWKIYEDYSDSIIKIRDELYKGHEDDEMYLFPHELGVPFEDSQTYSYYTDGAPMLLETGFIAPDSKMRKQMEAFFRNRGQFEKGLTGLMTSCDGAYDGAYHGGYGDVWYTMQSEWFWIPTWMAAGEQEKADESMEALMTYGLTPEFVVSERYCSINKWYGPWQPNGSGSARMAKLMLLYFGERRAKEEDR